MQHVWNRGCLLCVGEGGGVGGGEAGLVYSTFDLYIPFLFFFSCSSF